MIVELALSNFSDPLIILLPNPSAQLILPSTPLSSNPTSYAIQLQPLRAESSPSSPEVVIRWPSTPLTWGVLFLMSKGSNFCRALGAAEGLVARLL
jgi:hypothetical protein